MKIPKDKWPDIIRQCKASGLSDWEWCRRNNICDSTFYYQLKKHKDIACTPGEVIQPKLPEYSQRPCPEQHDIVPLIIRDDDVMSVANVDHRIAAKLTVKGISIELYNDTGSDVIKSIISALVSL